MWQFDDTWQVTIAQRYLMRWIACMLREINLVGCSHIDIIIDVKNVLMNFIVYYIIIQYIFIIIRVLTMYIFKRFSTNPFILGTIMCRPRVRNDTSMLVDVIDREENFRMYFFCLMTSNKVSGIFVNSCSVIHVIYVQEWLIKVILSMHTFSIHYWIHCKMWRNILAWKSENHANCLIYSL
jgi:hypothetical protein